MFTKQTALAGVVSAVAMFLVSWLLFGLIFAGALTGAQSTALQGAMSDSANLPLLFLSYLILAWMMAFIYPFGYKGGSKVAEGFRFGIVIWILVVVSQGLDWQSWGLLGWGLFFWNIVLYFVQYAVGGIVIGLLASGNGSTVAAEPVMAEPAPEPVPEPSPEAEAAPPDPAPSG